MRQRWMITIIGAVLILAAFAGGVVAGSTGILGVHSPVLSGSGYVGDHVVTLFSGDDAYGARGSIAWRGADGSEHESGWPDCLPLTTEVSAIPFTGTVVWHGGIGSATILWVDCQARG